MEKWYEKPGTQQEVVISSRIRLARNLEGRLFESHLKLSEKKALAEEVTQCLSRVHLENEKNLSIRDIEELVPAERGSLVERYLISPNFLLSTEGKRALISKDESTTFMINEEDHVRMQVLQSGLGFEKGYKYLNALDQILDSELHFAYDLKWGYLTACPTNLGTGLRVSAMLHLPMLEQTGNLTLLQEQLVKMGYTIRGTYGEGSKARGSCYQISNEITLGITEERAMEGMTEVVEQLIIQEMNLREKSKNVALEDRVFRACGVLLSARLLTFDELTEGISALRLGVSLGYLKELSFNQLDRMQLELGDSTLLNNEKTENMDEIRQKRADYVREALKSVKI